MRTALLIIVFLAISVAVAAEEVPRHIEAGPLILDVYISRTAHLFHVVDELSAWDYYCIPEYYAKGLPPLSEEDRSVLARHKAVRTKRGWGGGLEQTFYTQLDLEAALRCGVENQWLTQEQAQVEREVFSHFAGRVDKLLQDHRAHLVAFRERLERTKPELGVTASKFARFTEKTPCTIPVFLLATPDKSYGSGGYNGGRLTLGIPTERDPYPTLLHELFHAFLQLRWADLKQAAAGVCGLDAQTINEGIAHALMPGIIHSDDGLPDPLLYNVRKALIERKSLSDPDTRFSRYGLALRPILKVALEDEKQTLATFLPRAIDIWRALSELEPAMGGPQ